MNTLNQILSVIGCAAAFLVFFLFLFFITRKNNKNAEYDERQIAAQGAAYKAAFWTMLVYYMLYAIISGAAEIVWCDQYLGIFLGVIVGVTVFALICVFRDAYFHPDQSSASAIILINVICISQGIIGFLHLSDGTVVENGVLSGDAIQLFLLLMGLVLDVAFIVKHRMEKHEEQE